jgi:hypothetical protein
VLIVLEEVDDLADIKEAQAGLAVAGGEHVLMSPNIY